MTTVAVTLQPLPWYGLAMSRQCSIEGCDRQVSCKNMCKKHYEHLRRYGTIHPKPRKEPCPCSLDACSNMASNYYFEGKPICQKHYMRLYRHGDPFKTARRSGVGAPSSAYRRVRRRGHPLARANGEVWEHRANLYDKIGAGPVQCFHCGKAIYWFVADPTSKNDPRLIQADHLDSDRSNNSGENLVPSCQPCNTRKGQHRRRDALRAEGWFSSHDTQNQ